MFKSSFFMGLTLSHSIINIAYKLSGILCVCSPLSLIFLITRLKVDDFSLVNFGVTIMKQQACLLDNNSSIIILPEAYFSFRPLTPFPFPGTYPLFHIFWLVIQMPLSDILDRPPSLPVQLFQTGLHSYIS